MPRVTILPEGSEETYRRFQFAPGVEVGGTVWCSGQLGIGPDGRAIEDPEEQFVQAFQNLQGVLEKAGLTFAHVVELTTFHVGLRQHLRTFADVKSRFVTEPFPAWTAIGVSELAVEGCLVEVRATAHVDAE
jgi:enamine deaminase RidA (YjgF/YER057c/UK114 family)